MDFLVTVLRVKVFFYHCLYLHFPTCVALCRVFYGSTVRIFHYIFQLHTIYHRITSKFELYLLKLL